MEKLNSLMEMTGYTGNCLCVGIFVVFMAGVCYVSRDKEQNQTEDNIRD